MRFDEELFRESNAAMVPDLKREDLGRLGKKLGAEAPPDDR
jgi:hypothetical protein